MKLNPFIVILVVFSLSLAFNYFGVREAIFSSIFGARWWQIASSVFDICFASMIFVRLALDFRKNTEQN